MTLHVCESHMLPTQDVATLSVLFSHLSLNTECWCLSVTYSPTTVDHKIVVVCNLMEPKLAYSGESGLRDQNSLHKPRGAVFPSSFIGPGVYVSRKLLTVI